MNKQSELFRRLSAFAEDEHPLAVRTEWNEHTEKEKKQHRRPQAEPTAQLARFFRSYRIAVSAFLVLLLVMLLATAVSIPPFADENNPVNNEVVERYVGSAEAETGAENVIAGMILNYRGFDTFGESSVLFVALCCVMLLLWADERNSSEEERRQEEKEELPPDPILQEVSRWLIPCLVCFGITVLLGGHVSPGGGFSGGSILGATLILFATAFGAKTVRRFFTERVFQIIRITGLAIYALMFGVYIFFGANGIRSNIAHYIVLVIDIAVGLVVMSTMYGFYAFFTKGEL